MKINTKRGILACGAFLLSVVTAASMAFFADRESSVYNVAIAEFMVDGNGYELGRKAKEGPYEPGNTIPMDIQEKNKSGEPIDSDVELVISWEGIESGSKIFGNSDPNANAKIDIGGTSLSYTLEGNETIRLVLPNNLIPSSGSTERKLNLKIPEQLTSGGIITYVFDQSAVSQNPVGFSKVFSREELNTPVDLTFKAEVKAVSGIPVLRAWPAPRDVISNDDFHNSAYRTRIVSCDIVDKAVPSGVVAGPWDVSDQKDGTVTAWLTNAPGGYHLTISGNGYGKIYANEDSSALFYDFTGLRTINGLSLLDTSNATTLDSMFRKVAASTIDTSHFNTSKVTSMNSTFRECPNLRSVDLRNFDVSNVTNMYCLFFQDGSLSSTNFAGWDTSSVQIMRNMFYGCRSLRSIDVTMFNTSSCVNMNGMFCNCSGLSSLNVKNFNTSRVTDFGAMFRGCSGLTNLDVSNFSGASANIINSMFRECGNMQTVNISNFSVPNATDAGAMFMSSGRLHTIYEPNWNTRNLRFTQSMFTNCYSLRKLELTGMDTSYVNSMQSMFMGCQSASYIHTGNFRTRSVTDMRDLFHYCYSLRTLECNNFTATHLGQPQLTNMFTGCNSVSSSYCSDYSTCNVFNNYVNGRPGNVWFSPYGRSALQFDLNGGQQKEAFDMTFDLNGGTVRD